MTAKENKAKEGNIRQKNKALILATAKEEFVTFGFSGASMKHIAEKAGLPRANVHYYFKSKEDLYNQLLRDILDVWNSRFDNLNEDKSAKEALTAYIRAKVLFSKTDPIASRIFACEIIQGAPHLKEYLHTELKDWIEDKAKVINGWISAKQMNPVNPYHLLFMIWGATQHYADFNTQIVTAMGKEKLDDEDFEDVITSLTQIILTGCGIE
jgi:TetR/AcrR family transcriptional regulator